MTFKTTNKLTEEKAAKEGFRQLTHSYTPRELPMLKRASEQLDNGGIEWCLVDGKEGVQLWRKNFTEIKD